MKKLFLSLFFAFLALGLSAEETIIFSLKNETKTPLTQLYVSKSSTDLWGDEILKGKTSIPVDGSLRLSFSISQYDNLFDIKAMNANGDIFSLFEVLVQNSASVNITNKDYQGTIDSVDSLDSEELEAFNTKSAFPKKYLNGYKQGFLNGYSSGFEAGFAACQKMMRQQQEAAQN